jgi:hypothetical protein
MRDSVTPLRGVSRHVTPTMESDGDVLNMSRVVTHLLKAAIAYCRCDMVKFVTVCHAINFKWGKSVL